MVSGALPSGWARMPATLPAPAVAASSHCVQIPCQHCLLCVVLGQNMTKMELQLKLGRKETTLYSMVPSRVARVHREDPAARKWLLDPGYPRYGAHATRV